MEGKLIPVLFIAHHFPPMSGPGMFRSFNLARFLPQFGYKPIVLTITQEDIKETGQKIDEELLGLLPASSEIHRVPTKEPRKLSQFLMKLRINRLFWFFFFPITWEPSALWPFSARKTALKLIKEKQIPLIYTSSGPYSAMLLAYLLKRKTGLPWVADLRDPYTDGYAWQWPSKFHWYLSRAAERWMLSKADHVIVNTPEVEKLYLRKKLVPLHKIEVITNGF